MSDNKSNYEAINLYDMKLSNHKDERWPRLSVQPNPIYKWIPASFQAAMGSGSRLL